MSLAFTCMHKLLISPLKNLTSYLALIQRFLFDVNQYVDRELLYQSVCHFLNMQNKVHEDKSAFKPGTTVTVWKNDEVAAVMIVLSINVCGGYGSFTQL